MALQSGTERNIEELLAAEEWTAIQRVFAELHPADIADLIEHTDPNDQVRLFSLVDDEVKPDVLAELDGAAEDEVILSLSNHELSEIVEDMAPDDAADVVGELPRDRAEQVLGLMEQEDSREVRTLLEYPEDSAGGIMTTDVVAMLESQTVDEALQAIAYVDSEEPFYSANVVDESGRLVGSVDVWELLRQRDRSRPLGELAHRDVISVPVDMDQEDVAKTLAQYDLQALPVVDKAGRLVGRITADDAIDVLEEEASEDILRMAGAGESALQAESVLQTCLVRLPWLFITLAGGLLTSLLLNRFISSIPSTLVLAAFVPVVLAMGGNTGIQSATLVVRSIALGTLKGRSILRLLGREIGIGAAMGGICGIGIALISQILIRTELTSYPIHLSLIVALALFCAMTFAAVFGAFVPIALDRLRIDPAVASGPFVTITNDISALVIYFAVTTGLLGALENVPRASP